MNQYKAILLLGPTGAGKTPLGELLQKNGLRRTKCHHFDFGSQLRKISSSTRPNGSSGRKSTPKYFTNADIAFIRRVLNDNLLLDEKHFYIAEKILKAFIKDNTVKQNDLIILNGLPRHIGQAKKIDSILKIELVVYLSCTAQVVYERIRRNTGGDRTGRIDDTINDIRNKLKIFRKKTALLLNHYRSLKILIKTIHIGINTTAENILKIIES